VEVALEEELVAALVAKKSQRVEERRGYRHGSRPRNISGHTGPLGLTVPRGRLFGPDEREREWESTILPRYQHRFREVNEAVLATYLGGGNTRRIRGAFKPLLKDAPLSRSSVSRIVTQLKGDLDAWRKRDLAKLDVVYLYLDAIVLRIRRAGHVVNAPVLVTLGVMLDGSKQVLSLAVACEESTESWKATLVDLAQRKLRRPVLCIVDGHPGLNRAVTEQWSGMLVQRCCVHKQRNLLAAAPRHAHADVMADFADIVYASDEEKARAARSRFITTWKRRCPAVAESVLEAGDELLTFFQFPPSQWKVLRTTNVIERLNGEFRRRVKTQGAYPDDESALVLLFGLLVTGQITLRRMDGWRDLAKVVRSHGSPQDAGPAVQRKAA
jgi:transposase-like protein